MAVNVTANWRLIRSLDPLLRASDAGRAIFVTSGAAHTLPAYWGPYSVSKAALEALVRTYAAETATTPVRVMLVNPGPLRTRMRAAAMPGEDPQTLQHAGRARAAHRAPRLARTGPRRARSTISRRTRCWRRGDPQSHERSYSNSSLCDPVRAKISSSSVSYQMRSQSGVT